METGLDFAQARYFSNSQGRFNSPDPLIASARRQIPQSWNRYAYVINNPLTYFDPTGESWIRDRNGYVFFDKDVTTNKQARKKYGPGATIIDGHDVVSTESHGNSGFIVGHFYTLNADGTKVDHGVYTPPAAPHISTQYGDEMAAFMVKLYLRAAWAGATGGTGVISILLSSADVSSEFWLQEDESDPATMTMAAGTTVYISYRPDGTPEYVGITDDFVRRSGEHLRNGRIIREVPGLGNLSREEARGVEQALIRRYGFIREGGSLSNIRNSISATRPYFKTALRRGLQILRRSELR